jgi:hypothetical protein
VALAQRRAKRKEERKKIILFSWLLIGCKNTKMIPKKYPPIDG